MKYNVIAISGSLEQQSLARNILKKSIDLNLDNLNIQLCSIEGFPLLNVDLIGNAFPKEIQEARDKIANADAILFVTPQFFGKVSPALKNAYDWISYSPNLQMPSPIRNIPASMITIGKGEDGSLVQKFFIQMGQFCRIKIMNKPSLHFSTENKAFFGQKMQLNEKGIDQLKKFLEYFGEFISKKKKSS